MHTLPTDILKCSHTIFSQILDFQHIPEEPRALVRFKTAGFHSPNHQPHENQSIPEPPRANDSFSVTFNRRTSIPSLLYHLPHLPKVSHFPAFSSHLPKVRRITTATRAACSRIHPSTTPFTPSEGEPFHRVFIPPSEGEPFPRIFVPPFTPSEGVGKMYICGTPLEGVRRWNKDRMAVRSAVARIREIHSFGRSGGKGPFAYSFRRG